VPKACTRAAAASGDGTVRFRQRLRCSRAVWSSSRGAGQSLDLARGLASAPGEPPLSRAEWTGAVGRPPARPAPSGFVGQLAYARRKKGVLCSGAPVSDCSNTCRPSTTGCSSSPTSQG